MTLKKLGTYFIIGSLILIALDIYLIANGYINSFSAQVIPICILLSTFSLGLSLPSLNAPPHKRMAHLKIYFIISFLIWLTGLYFKVNLWFGASILVILGSFLFAFATLPLLVKHRYEKWKSFTSSSLQTLIVSLADLLSLMLILMGFLSKFMHWPGSISMITTGGVLLVISFFGWNQIFKSSIRFRKTAEDQLQNAFGELKEKHLIIEEKNKEITDSINYAKRIQTAVLPDGKLLSNFFDESFILFHPKDIVSGDFYWMTEESDYFFYATADCTGHGVPGAFMSMLGCSFLNEIIIEKKILEPAEILNNLREKIIYSLKQSENVGENKDGMDIVLIRIHKNKKELVYAAANNEFYIIRNHEILYLKANKQPVGFYQNEKIPFTQHRIELNKDDRIYTFTDGFPDQFGGHKGKKLKYKYFEELILKNHLLPFHEQNKNYTTFLNNWKGDLEQNDDICVIGIKI